MQCCAALSFPRCLVGCVSWKVHNRNVKNSDEDKPHISLRSLKVSPAIFGSLAESLLVFILSASVVTKALHLLTRQIGWGSTSWKAGLAPLTGNALACNTSGVMENSGPSDSNWTSTEVPRKVENQLLRHLELVLLKKEPKSIKLLCLYQFRTV